MTCGPATPGVYSIEIDAVVEHKFWASWHGVEPTVMRVVPEPPPLPYQRISYERPLRIRGVR